MLCWQPFCLSFPSGISNNVVPCFGGRLFSGGIPMGFPGIALCWWL